MWAIFTEYLPIIVGKNMIVNAHTGNILDKTGSICTSLSRNHDARVR